MTEDPGEQQGDEPVDTPKTAMSVRTARTLRIVLGALFTISFLLFVLLMTVRYTVLDAAWYREVLAENRTYARIYDKVLVDPEVKEVTDDLVGSLPIDRSLIDANLRLVVPPDTLRDTLDRTLVTLTEWLRDERDDIDADFAIGSIEKNLERLNRVYLTDLVSGLEPLVTNEISVFTQRLEEFQAQIEAGQTPTAFPTLPPLPGAEGVVTDALMATIDGTPPPGVRDQVRAAVAAGDINSALALLVPLYRADDAAQSARDLREAAGGDQYDYGTQIVITEDSPEVKAVMRARTIIGDVLPIVTMLSAVLMGLTLAGIGYVAFRARANVPRTLAVTIFVGGVVVNVVWLIVRFVLGDPLSGLTSSDSGLPRSLRALVDDLGDSAFSDFDGAILGMGQLAIIAGGATLLGLWLVPKAVTLVGRQSQRRLAYIGIAAGVALVVLGAALILRPDPVEAVNQRCNGHEELCDRRVDQVVFPMAHNAMSSSRQAWLNANNDLPAPAQLDLGVRGLMLDWWDWETPDRLLEFVESENIPPEYVDFLRAVVTGANPPKPGTFLCHGFCKLGHTRLDRGLRDVKEWLDDNPDEVIVVIAEDHIPAKAGEDAMRRSGLADYVYTPPKDPDARWPTLRALIERDERLIFFTEKRAGDAPWYRKGYQYMMETPYTFASPDVMSCAPKRGGTGKRLFLMNHWIQKAAPSRVDAAQVNARRFIVERAEQCKEERGQLPNFISVDFASLGDVVGATAQLNGLTR
ncbi:MAG: hypothetical protein WEC34_11910 [Acidimicrobiia bacterium]